MEVTKWLEPSDSGSRIGDRASVQAACLFESDEQTFLELIYRRKIMPPIVHIPGTCKSLDVARLRILFEGSSCRNRPSG